VSLRGCFAIFARSSMAAPLTSSHSVSGSYSDEDPARCGFGFAAFVFALLAFVCAFGCANTQGAAIAPTASARLQYNPFRNREIGRFTMGKRSIRKRVLVTGGAGYVGSHACKALAHAGYVPVVYDNLSRGHAWAVKWGSLERGDLLSPARLAAVIQKHRPVAVMHFAALISVGESVDDPLRYYQNNVGGTINLLEAMRNNGVDRIVFSSTASVYGIPERVPIPETHPQRPLNPYGHSKRMIEQMLSDSAAAFGLKSVSLRYFNAAGADSDGEIGEAHDPETHLIPLVLAAAAGLRARLTIHGTDYSTRDGTCIRDYVHVADLADAHVLALGYLATKSGASAFNLGNGEGFTVREVIAAAQKVTGLKIPLREGPRRPGDPPSLVANAASARRNLGWKPRYRDLEVIIGTAWRWLQSGKRDRRRKSRP
jgi:UDP-arabinose 4-epimerase